MQTRVRSREMNHTRMAMAHQLHSQIRLFETQNDQISGAPQLGCLADQNQWFFQILTQLCLKHPQSISYDTLKCIKIHINTYYRFIEYYTQYIAVKQIIIDNYSFFFRLLVCVVIYILHMLSYVFPHQTHLAIRLRVRGSARPSLVALSVRKPGERGRFTGLGKRGKPWGFQFMDGISMYIPFFGE